MGKLVARWHVDLVCLLCLEPHRQMSMLAHAGCGRPGGPDHAKDGGYGGFESADGRFLYYPKFYMIGTVWRVRVAGGEEAPVDEGVVSRRGPANYVVRPEGIYSFASDNPPRGSSLQVYRFAGSKIEILGDIGVSLGRGGMTVSPDGRWLLFTDNARERGDLMLVENFR